MNHLHTISQIIDIGNLNSGGGIRYNSSLKYIQIEDTSNNWINWKYYNPNAQFKYITHRDGISATVNLSYENTGLYLIAVAGGTFTLNTAGTVTTLVDTTLVAVYANAGQVGTITFNAGAYSGSLGVFYVSNNHKKAELISTASVGNNQSTSASISSETDIVLLAMIGGNQRNATPISYSCTTNQQASDSLSYACCSTVNETGSASITVRGGNSGSSCLIRKIRVYN